MKTVKLPNLDPKTYTALVGGKLISFEALSPEEAQEKIKEMMNPKIKE